MKKVTPFLIITDGQSTASFYTAEPMLGDVRVTGWVKAPSKDIGFAFDDRIAKLIGQRSLGGFCWDDEGPVDFCFQFDVRPAYNLEFHRRETTDEIIKRIQKSLRAAKRSIAKLA